MPISTRSPDQPKPEATTPRTTVDMVKAIAEKYSDTALPTTNKQFIVLQEHDTTPLKEKTQLAMEATRQGFDESDAKSFLAANVLHVMSAISPSTSTSAWPYLGVVLISPKGIDDSRAFGDDIQRDVTWSVLHELGHINMAHLDKGKDRYSDYTFETLREEYKAITGWERTLPKDLIDSLRAITVYKEPELLPRGIFPSDAEYKSYVEMRPLLNAQDVSNTIKTLHTLVGETYADSFTVLSHAAKEGVKEALVMADLIRDFRVVEAEGPISSSTHDSSRGLAWLSTYLRSSAGEKLVDQLNQGSCDRECAQNIHRTAMKFTEINVRRWAQENGMEAPMANKLSAWVSDYYNEGERMPSQESTPIAKEPQVFAHTTDTIRALSKDVKPSEEKVLELTRGKFMSDSAPSAPR